MNNSQKSTLKAAGIFGVVGAAVIAPIATPVLWAALAYGTYRFAKATYQTARLKEAPPEEPTEDNWFF